MSMEKTEYIQYLEDRIKQLELEIETYKSGNKLLMKTLEKIRNDCENR